MKTVVYDTNQKRKMFFGSNMLLKRGRIIAEKKQQLIERTKTKRTEPVFYSLPSLSILITRAPACFFPLYH